jgi:hypothetical protein
MNLTDEQLKFWCMVRDQGVTAIPFTNGTDNLGDDIQSHAGQLWFETRQWVDRERPDKWGHHKVALCHFFWDMPVLAYSKAVVAGFYLCRHHLAKLEAKGLWDRLKAVVDAQGFPAGCRDIKTTELLQSKGIPSFFSGCVTGTLRKRANPGSECIAVDVDAPDGTWTTLSHKIPEMRKWNPVERMKYAAERLDRYAHAKEILTGRLHCYLPSKAMGVDVKADNSKSEMKDRWSGHLEKCID